VTPSPTGWWTSCLKAPNATDTKPAGARDGVDKFWVPRRSQRSGLDSLARCAPIICPSNLAMRDDTGYKPDGTTTEREQPQRNLLTSPGKRARVCKTLDVGSIPIAAAKLSSRLKRASNLESWSFIPALSPGVPRDYPRTAQDLVWDAMRRRSPSSSHQGLMRSKPVAVSDRNQRLVLSFRPTSITSQPPGRSRRLPAANDTPDDVQAIGTTVNSAARLVTLDVSRQQPKPASRDVRCHGGDEVERNCHAKAATTATIG